MFSSLPKTSVGVGASCLYLLYMPQPVSRDVATVPAANVPNTPFVRSFDDNASGGSAELSASGRPGVSCETSEQLYYLVMNGYDPLPKEGSTAATLYALAKQVIAERISPEMDDFKKIKAIYDYLTTEVYYDRETAYSEDTYLVKEQAYYLEGVFLNHCAVCDGKAKAYALLLNMAGVPCFRTTGVSSGGDHAWNMVQLDGRWYVSCTTYGESDMTGSIGRIVPNYVMMLSGRDTPYGEEGWGYESQKHPEVYEKLEDAGYDVYDRMGRDAGVDLVVSDLAKLRETAGKINLPGEFKIEFRYSGADPESFESDLAEYAASLANTQAAKLKGEGGPVYQLIYLK